MLLHEGGAQTGANAWDVNGCNGFDRPDRRHRRRDEHAIDVVVSGHTHQAYNCEIDGKLVTSASSARPSRHRHRPDDRPTTGDVLSAGANNVIVTRDVAKDPAQTDLIDALPRGARPDRERGRRQDRGAADQDPGAALPVGTNSNGEPVYAFGESALGNVIADAQLAATDDETGAPSPRS